MSWTKNDLIIKRCSEYYDTGEKPLSLRAVESTMVPELGIFVDGAYVNLHAGWLISAVSLLLIRVYPSKAALCRQQDRLELRV